MILVLFDAPSDFEQRVAGIEPDAEVVRMTPANDGYAEALEKADVVAGRPNVDDLVLAGDLTWLQLSSAGADRYVDRVRADVVITSASGVYDVPTSEHAVAMMLAMVRRVPHSVRSASARRWDRSGRYDELYGRTCGVLGLGNIGSAVARRVKAFGMRVLAVRRRPGYPPEYVDAVYGRESLYDMLPECDHVVNTLPGTTATERFMDAKALARMKPSAYLYNVGRGSTVDEEALVGALATRKLAGAGLDVFEEEPLPTDSPLWEMPNVLITPHTGGSSPSENERVAELFLENLGRRRRGEPLLNVVDRDLGY